MNKKNLFFLLAIFITIFFLWWFFIKPNQTVSQEKTTSQVNSQKKEEINFLIEGFPSEQVPLYKSTKVSSNKIFINTDPLNTSAFDEKNFAYYNVVFYSSASQEEFLDYYRGFFESQIEEEFPIENMIKGKIGQYKVSAAHYGVDQTAYLQVHLPNYDDEGLDRYFLDLPNLLPVNPILVEHERSYGLLNQKGGEVEFTQYFTVLDSGDQNQDGLDDVDEFALLEKEYQVKFGNETAYSYDEKAGLMKWQSGDFSVTLSISRDHGRLYLMMRKPLVN